MENDTWGKLEKVIRAEYGKMPAEMDSGELFWHAFGIKFGTDSNFENEPNEKRKAVKKVIRYIISAYAFPEEELIANGENINGRPTVNEEIIKRKAIQMLAEAGLK